MKKSKREWKLIAVALVFVMVISVTGCSSDSGDNGGKPTLVLADAGWDSIQFHNSVAQLIIENGYGYKTEIMAGSSPITVEALAKGDIDIYMEVWTDNFADIYYPAIEKGDVIELATNFDDNVQGLYVPTYMIKGDPERGIAPVAPDLKNIKDLDKYWELFKDPEDPSKGVIYGAIPGWAVDKILSEKIDNYGLNQFYNYLSPGSDAALGASMVRAYERGEAWVGYYWEPTWIMGLLDMTLLEDEPYSEELWNDGYRCEFPTVPVTVAVNKNMQEKAPEVVEFLKNYETSSALTNEALAYMQVNEVDADETAKWFLSEYEEIWTKWVPEEVASKVKGAL